MTKPPTAEEVKQAYFEWQEAGSIADEASGDEIGATMDVVVKKAIRFHRLMGEWCECDGIKISRLIAGDIDDE